MRRSGGYCNGQRLPEYNVWLSMRQRTRNPKHHAYARYGGRGIDCDPRWDSFAQFFSDMGVRPQGTTLDRISNSLGYSPSNCRWATLSEQNKNRDPRAWRHCGGRDGSPRCGYFAGHRGYCQSSPVEDVA